jgi:hypothetical protein
MSVVGGRMAFAAQEAAASTCTLVVPADPLSAKGLATPYELAGPCHETNPDTAAFVQATIVDPATGAVSVYDPLVVDHGKRPAVAPAALRLPAGAVVGIWFGFNGDNLVLRGTQNSLSIAACVNGLDKSIFGQYAYCNAPNFFAAATAAMRAGRLRIPSPGTGRDGLPCPTVRDFGLVDMDQSDNVTSTYLFLGNGTTAQNTAANEAALAGQGAQILINGSDNALLDDFLDPALGCTPFTAPDLAQPGRTTTSLALNELQAAVFQAAPVALVPLNDPMAVVNGKASVRKTDLYRAGVGQPPLNTATDTPQAYCADLASAGPARTEKDRGLTRRGKSPDPGAANNLFTFLAQRLSGAFDALDCGKLLKTRNPVTVVTNKQGVAIDARFANVAPPAASPSAQPSRSTPPTHSAPPSRPASRSASPTKSKAPTHSAPPPNLFVPSQSNAPTGSPKPTHSASGTTDGTPQGGQPSTSGGTAPAAPPPNGSAGTPEGQQPGQGTAPGGGGAAAGQPPAGGGPTDPDGYHPDAGYDAPGGDGTDSGAPVPVANIPTAPAPNHHTTAGAHKLPLTGSAPATALTVGSALLAIGFAFRTVLGWRRREQRVFQW